VIATYRIMFHYITFTSLKSYSGSSALENPYTWIFGITQGCPACRFLKIPLKISINKGDEDHKYISRENEKNKVLLKIGPG
jgi:hypothetical protein